jgi:hypothetical protein
MAMMSLESAGRRFKPRASAGQCAQGSINPRLTMFVEEALTIKISPVLTVNVPLSFVFKAESATRAA